MLYNQYQNTSLTRGVEVCQPSKIRAILGDFAGIELTAKQ